MSPQEMQKYMLQQLSSMDVPIQSEDLIAYINKAIHEFVKTKFNALMNRERQGFEQSPKRVEDLRELIVTTELDTLAVSQQIRSGIFIDKASLPENHFLLLSVGLKIYYNRNGIAYSTSSGKRQPTGTIDEDYAESYTSAKFVQHDDIYSVLDDPFNKPKITEGIYTIDDGDIYSYTTDKFVTDKVVLTYIREPATVVLNPDEFGTNPVTACDLSEAVHEDIVDLAVDLYAQDKMGMQRQQQQPEKN